MAERAALPQLGDTVAGKYRVECMIGSGGMSVVFGATHLVTRKRFALKWLAPVVDNDLGDSAQRFIREAQVAGRFQHPNVVEVYDVGQTLDGAHYMVMEWLEGEALSTRLDRVGSLSVAETCTYLLPCMHAIEDAHAAGIVHRDLKPANIFICQANKHGPERAKVLDFGIAKLHTLAPGEFSPVVTKTGMLIGTPYYLAPEQLRHLPVDARTDVYAFGVILYQVLTGKLPFTANNFAELVFQIATGTPAAVRELVPAISRGIELVIERAMARDPEQRFQRMSELAEALAAASGEARVEVPANVPIALASSQPLEAPASVPAPPAAPRARWGRWAGVLALCAGAALWVRWWMTEQADAERPRAVQQPAQINTVAHAASAPEQPVAPAPQPSAANSTAPPPAPGPAALPTRLSAPAIASPPPDPTPPPRRPQPRPRPTPAVPAAKPAEPAPPPPPAAEDRNPLHMKLQ